MPGPTHKIEELIEINNELVQLNDELESYFRNTIIPQLYIDAGLVLQKFTPPAMKQFNLKADDIGKSINDVKENLRFPIIIDNIHQVIDSREILEKEIQTTDRRWYQMNIIPYMERRSHKMNGVIITFVEITMRINDLKDLEKLISDYEILLDTISHDVKTPITSLVLALELFRNASPENPQEYQSLFKIVENAVTQMHNLINDLTNTRRQEYKYKAEEELLNFEHIWEDVRLTLNDNIRESGAVIKTGINVSQMTFSRRKLRSIVYNLVKNAIKFKSAERHPEIFIKTEREGDFIIISVKDNGIGIDKSKQEVIFSKYFRAENAIEGSGIGLYLVKEIVNNSGGKIIVNSDRGKGSEFRVFLQAD